MAKVKIQFKMPIFFPSRVIVTTLIQIFITSPQEHHYTVQENINIRSFCIDAEIVN